MRPARIVTTALFAAAVAVTGCTAHSTVAHPAAPKTPAATPLVSAPKPSTPAPPTTPAPTAPTPRQPTTLRCDPSALRGSVLGTEGAAGTIWVTIQLRNVSARTCVVEGRPDVRLLGAQGQPVLPPSVPDGPAGSVVALRSGAAARFAFGASNVCDSTVVGFSIRVTPTPGRGALLVRLANGLDTDSAVGFTTCRTLQVQALELVPGSGPAVLADGRYPVLLKAVDPGRGRITFDVIQFFQGDDAVGEAAKDHQESPPPNDHYARNVSTRLRTLPLGSDATVTVNGLLSTQKSIPVSLTRLATLTRTYSPMFWITVRDDQVIKIGEQWMP
jgi:hypothetical protein